MFYREATDSASQVERGKEQFRKYGGHLLIALINSFSSERRRWMLWSPVLLGIGILTYFQLTFEPSAHFLLATPILTISAILFHRRFPSIALYYFLPLILFTAGFNIAGFRSLQVSAPILHKSVGSQFLEGKVISRSGSQGAKRLLLTDLSFDNDRRVPKLEYIRLTYRTKGEDPSPGQYVRLKAVLMPPPSPVIPGGFDYQRQLYFQKIGAVGYVIKHPQILDRDVSLFDDIRVLVNRMRLKINDRVKQILDPGSAGFAVTILTGDKSGIDAQTLGAMRTSGLAHLLAISGLHMGFIGGLIFFAVRLALSLSPAIALQLPIKKIAAVFAIIGIALYLALSGLSVSALRAFIMAGLAFLAICADRNAFSLRMVVLAAMVILIIFPESLLGPSFQMSFAAVFALISVYESWGHKFIQASRKSSLMRKSGLYLAGVLLTTLIASAATAPFTIYHFGQFPLYGMIANLLAIPIMGFWIMPMVLLTLLSMPFGLDQLPLLIMAQGIEVIQQVALYVAHLPNSILLIANLSAPAIFLISLSGMWFLLWKGKWRYLSIAGMLLSLVINNLQSTPNILLSDSGHLLGYYNQSGQLMLTSGKKEKFARKKWQRYYGLPKADTIIRNEYRPNSSVNCDPSGCLFHLGEKILSYAQNRSAIEEDCKRVDMIISPHPVSFACKKSKTVIDKFSFWQNGAYSITLSSNDRLEIKSANALRGNRPWVPQKKFKKKSD